MKIISWNVNGINAWNGHGGLDALLELDPDIVVFQETKGDDDKFNRILESVTDRYKLYHQGSQYKSGYAGVGAMVKLNLSDTLLKSEGVELGDEYMSGRVIHLEFPDFHVIGVYTLNSGGDKDELRIEWDRRFGNWIWELDKDKPVIILGDLNVVPNQLDYWSNLEYGRNTCPGLMDFERDHHSKFLSTLDFVDTFRHLNPSTRTYSWFSYRGNSYDSNKGWRIDLALCSRRLLDRVSESGIRDDIRYSDHCPIVVTLS